MRLLRLQKKQINNPRLRRTNQSDMNQQPNAIEAISEALRRLHLNIKGDTAAGRWEAIKIVTAYQKELTDACIDRIESGVDEWEEIQREAEQDKQAQDEAYNALRCAGQPR